jgi:hypothetical protein
MTAALMRTGVVEVVSRKLLQFTSKHPGSLLPATMLAVGLLSAVINNTAAAAFFLPVILGLSQRSKLSASRLLMPMAFAAILASSMTLVSTSTNVVVSGLMTQAGLPPIGMLELTPVGVPVLVVGILYMLFFGQRLIPERPAPETLTETFGLRPYLAELRITSGSPLAGTTLAQSGLGRDFDLTVLAIIREGKRQLDPPADAMLQAGDKLLVEGPSEAILKVKDIPGIDIQADAKFSDIDLQEMDWAGRGGAAAALAVHWPHAERLANARALSRSRCWPSTAAPGSSAPRLPIHALAIGGCASGAGQSKSRLRRCKPKMPSMCWG